MRTIPPTNAYVRSAPRRAFFTRVAMLGAGLALPAASVRAQGAPPARWCTSWATAPAGPPPAASVQQWSGQSMRLIVRTSVGGRRLRIRLSNEMGSTPLAIGHASVGLRASGAAVAPGTLRPLRFGGQAGIVLAPGAPALSDPVDLNLPAQADLAVSVHFPGTVPVTTLHNAALQTSYLSSSGDYTASLALPVARTLSFWPFLSAVEVEADAPCVVVLGDSLSDGQGSAMNANSRWPDCLARRLHSALGAAGPIGVANRGLSGNCLLTDYATALLAGRDAQERFDRDVLATSGARWLVLFIGINDICYSNGSNPVPARDLIAGYRQLIARARARGLGVIGTTLTPFAGFVYDTPAREAVRRETNDWLRASTDFDALLDADLALRDPFSTTRLRPAYDSGDHLHPNNAGHLALANAMPVAPFMGSSVASRGTDGQIQHQV